ncbi:thiol S-methyltransferase TMT1A-like [Diadema antillarum]|uniref:thiol S-methyltransferase TMT1A-like n=1 Tax=Diadema antillarum TaxID=105358 RepID=UPI003A839696
MATEDSEIGDYFRRYVVPLAILFLCLRVFLFVFRRYQPVIYVKFYDGYAEMHHKAFKVQKEKLLSQMSSFGAKMDAGDDKSDQNNKSDHSGKRIRAVEIGCGPGVNFGYYPPDTSLTVVEPNRHFMKAVAENSAAHPNLRVTGFVCAEAENLKEHIADASQDIVVSTLALCSVRDVTAVISEVHRILKPGGRFYFIDHTASDPGDLWCRFMQAVMGSYVQFVAHCSLTRKPWIAIDRVGFSKVCYTRQKIKALPAIFKYHVYGYAVK